MPLTRQVRFSGPRVKLAGQKPETALSDLEPWLNQVRDSLLGNAVVVPKGSQSVDPEDGELLLQNGILYLALGGTYHQVWPADAAGASAAVEETLRELFLYREHEVLFAPVSCAINATTTVIAAQSGKRIAVKRIKVCNPDTAAGKTFHFNWGSATTDNLHKGFLDKNGGTHIESFIGSPCIGDAGEAFTCTVSNDGTSALYVTVGYLVLDPEELA